jgi:hypothetical protein
MQVPHGVVCGVRESRCLVTMALAVDRKRNPLSMSILKETTF